MYVHLQAYCNRVCFFVSCLVRVDVIYSSKRQTADMRLSELQAINEILNRITPGCSSYACGVVDVYSRYRYACLTSGDECMLGTRLPYTSQAENAQKRGALHRSRHQPYP